MNQWKGKRRQKHYQFIDLQHHSPLDHPQEPHHHWLAPLSERPEIIFLLPAKIMIENSLNLFPVLMNVWLYLLIIMSFWYNKIQAVCCHFELSEIHIIYVFIVCLYKFALNLVSIIDLFLFFFGVCSLPEKWFMFLRFYCWHYIFPLKYWRKKLFERYYFLFFISSSIQYLFGILVY